MQSTPLDDSLATIQATSLSATNPRRSCWVTASAGTGKTKLLTDRFLRLLLAGITPEHILCLTFTKNAAHEMQTRILDRLAHWATCEPNALIKEITALEGTTPSPLMLALAQALYGQLLCQTEPLQIMTLHGFCHSMLTRFSMEAGLSVGFTVMSEIDQRTIITDILTRFWERTTLPEDAVGQAITRLSASLGEYRLLQLMENIVKNAVRFEGNLSEHLSVFYETLDLEQRPLPQSEIIRAFCEDAGHLLATLAPESEIHAWWQQDLLARQQTVQSYILLFLTKTHTPRKRLLTAAESKAHPTRHEALLLEQERALRFWQSYSANGICTQTEDILTIAESFLASYHQKTTDRGLLDFNQLIERCVALLHNKEIAPWILYKLGRRIHHVLVDEAQDTNLKQWQIIHALTEEFFATTPETPSTLFVVGDEKQSIYSFQGADPLIFAAVSRFYHEHVLSASLSFSFRSAPVILELVDRLANDEAMQRAIVTEATAIVHAPFFSALPGWVSLWPLLTPLEEAEPEIISPWQAKEAAPAKHHPQWCLAETIAITLANWLAEARHLASKNRPLDPGDIMILVRKRGRFIEEMVRALNRHHIPASGLDRIALMDSLAVQDTIALLRFILHPHDSFNLACVLKAPYLDHPDHPLEREDILFALAHNRGEVSLWERLACLQPESHAYRYLNALLTYEHRMVPSAVISHVLEGLKGRAAFYARLGDEALEMLEILEQVAHAYEQQHIPNLQHFIYHLETHNADIKRDLEQPAGKVRIMTAHASKGLQSPIVILADSVTPPSTRDLLFWTKTEPAFPVVPSASLQQFPYYASLLENESSARHDEYLRLLYVAITRAECGLIICGAAAASEAPALSWYTHAARPIKELGSVKNFALPPSLQPYITTQTDQSFEMGDEHALLTPTQQLAVAPAVAIPSLPDFAFTAPAEHPHDARTLLPSLLATHVTFQSTATPLAESNARAYGTLIHQLLEHAHRLDPQQLAAKIDALAFYVAPHFDAVQKLRAHAEIHQALNHPELAPFLGPDAYAEVPIFGHVLYQGEPRNVSGRIDRMVVLAEEVHILDFKTNRHPPLDVTGIADATRQQLALYALVLATIYPTKSIRSFVYFTSTGAFFELENTAQPTAHSTKTRQSEQLLH